MKHTIFLLLLLVGLSVHAQIEKKGKVVSAHFLAPSLKGNPGGEAADRSMTIYLPR